MDEKQLIDRSRVIKELNSIALQVSKEKLRTVARCLNAIEILPIIDAVPVVHGRWILGEPITCSVCGKPAAEHDSPITFWKSPYCPWCGAKMDLKEATNEENPDSV